MVAETGIPFDKIKLLAGKKPVGDSKVLKDVLLALAGSGGGGDAAGVVVVELGVMVLGGGAVFFKGLKESDGAAAGAGAGEKEKEIGGGGEDVVMGGGVEAEVATAAAAPVAQGLSGEGVLKTEVFWEDLKGYLQQRVRDEAVAGEALGVFRGAWEGRS